LYVRKHQHINVTFELGRTSKLHPDNNNTPTDITVGISPESDRSATKTHAIQFRGIARYAPRVNKSKLSYEKGIVSS
jgi:hypothetical protein